MSSEPSTEQANKALQAQNAQFQELFMNLAKGQQDLKALILKEKKKKKKKTVLFNMGHRFGNRLRDEVDLTTSSGGKDSQEERRAPSPVVLDNETDQLPVATYSQICDPYSAEPPSSFSSSSPSR